MSKPNTIEDALKLVPTHILLEHKKDRLRKLDELYYEGWNPVHPDCIGDFVIGRIPIRRPIPEATREKMAKQIYQIENEPATMYKCAFESWLLEDK